MERRTVRVDPVGEGSALRQLPLGLIADPVAVAVRRQRVRGNLHRHVTRRLGYLPAVVTVDDVGVHGDVPTALQGAVPPEPIRTLHLVHEMVNLVAIVQSVVIGVPTSGVGTETELLCVRQAVRIGVEETKVECEPGCALFHLVRVAQSVAIGVPPAVVRIESSERRRPEAVEVRVGQRRERNVPLQPASTTRPAVGLDELAERRREHVVDPRIERRRIVVEERPLVTDRDDRWDPERIRHRPTFGRRERVPVVEVDVERAVHARRVEIQHHRQFLGLGRRVQILVEVLVVHRRGRPHLRHRVPLGVQFLLERLEGVLHRRRPQVPLGVEPQVRDDLPGLRRRRLMADRRHHVAEDDVDLIVDLIASGLVPQRHVHITEIDEVIGFHVDHQFVPVHRSGQDFGRGTGQREAPFIGQIGPRVHPTCLADQREDPVEHRHHADDDQPDRVRGDHEQEHGQHRRRDRVGERGVPFGAVERRTAVHHTGDECAPRQTDRDDETDQARDPRRSNQRR